MSSRPEPRSVDPPQAISGSPHAFIVRVWSENVENTSEIRGRIQHVATGAFRNFRHYSELTTFITDCMDRDDLDRPTSGGQEARP